MSPSKFPSASPSKGPSAVPSIFPTGKPSSHAPSTSPTSCQNVQGYKFITISSEEKGCLWLGENQDRIDRYCFGDNEIDQNGELIRENCQLACGLCGLDPSAPSDSPSFQPSQSPSTLEPTPAPTICGNVSGYKFENLNGVLKGCGWLGENQNRVDRYCYGVNEIDQNGELIRENCRLVCGLCDSPSSNSIFD